jgi:cobalamin synthase
MVTNQIIVAAFSSNRSSGVNGDLVGLFLQLSFFFENLSLGQLLLVA